MWARRFGSFALPLAVIGVLLHRQGSVPTNAFEIVAVIAIACATLGLVLGLAALVWLWFTGDRGWARAVTGVALGALCLAPLAYAVYEVPRYPTAQDLTTDPRRPPALPTPREAPPVGTDGQPLVAALFPNLIARRYALDAPRTFDIAMAVANRYGWQVTSSRRPTGPLAEGSLVASVTTLIGFRDEVGVRVTGDSQGAVVDMRSAAGSSWPDLGENGRRIESFLAALDADVTTFLRENPESPEDAGGAEPPPVVQGP